MPMPTVTATWGRESWSAVLLEPLYQQSALLSAPVTRVVTDGRVVHIPRVLVDPVADWTAELAELPTDAGSGDTLQLVPKKVGDVIVVSNESIEDSSVGQLNAVGRMLVRGVSKKLDATFFDAAASTALRPAGIRNGTLPGGTGAVDVEGLIGAVGAVAAAGGTADTIFVSAADLTALRQSVVAGGYAISDPTAPGVERIAGAQLVTAPLPAGTAIVAQADVLVVAVARDIAVEFSSDAGFGVDGTACRITARFDWAVGDPAGVYVLTAA